jgi:hypothetical protein
MNVPRNLPALPGFLETPAGTLQRPYTRYMGAECKRTQSGEENPVKGSFRASWGLFRGGLSKVIINPRLFHDYICHISGFYFTVYRKIPVGNGAMPHIMIALAMPQKETAVF